MEYENEQVKEDQPVDNRSLQERIVDKNWKTRVSAYEELGNQIKNVLGDDPIFDEYSPLLPKILSDSNASALDAGLALSLLFIDTMPEGSISSFMSKYCEKLTTCVVDKALIGRTTVQSKGKLFLLKLMEIDEPTTCTTVLLGRLFDKKIKIPPLCLEIIKEGIGLFGVKEFPVRDILPKLGEVMNKGSSDTRAVAMSLMFEISKWIGTAPLASVLENIKPVQKAEFDSLCEGRDPEEGRPVPSLYLRKDRMQKLNATASGSPKATGTKSSVLENDDAREYVEEVDLLKVLKSTDYVKLVAEEKWSEQLKGLQIVIDSVGPTPKIKPGSDLHDIVGVCKGFLRAGHLSVQQASLKIIALFADGLRNDFTNALRPVLQMVIFKSKEKRLINDVKVVLKNAVLFCVPFESLCDDISELVKNKKTPPHGRLCLMETTIDVLTTCPQKVNNESLKAIADMLTFSCEDSDPKVREMCVQAFVTLSEVIKSRGRSAIDAHKLISKLEQTTPKVFKKIASMKELGTGAKPTSRPAIGRVASTSASIPMKKAAPSALSKSKSMNVKSSTDSFKKAKTATSKIENDNEIVEEVTMGFDEATELLCGMKIENWDQIQQLLSSAKWQEKVEGLTSIENFVRTDNVGGVLCVPLTSFLKKHFPKLKSTNMNIVKAMMQLYSTCASHAGSTPFSKSVVVEIVDAWGDKFSDKKGKDSLSDLLSALAGSVSPRFCIMQLKKVMDKVKAPVGRQNFLEWLKSVIDDFGVGVVPVQTIVFFCHSEFENKNAGVRTAAVEVMAALYHQLGPKFLSIAITDAVKPAMKSILEAEFDKVGYDGSKRPSRNVQGQACDEKKAGFSIPRVDLGNALDRSVIGDLTTTEGKNSWQIRKTAMEAIIDTCERSGHFIEGNGAVKEVLKSLKARLHDTQANLKPMAAHAIGHVLSSLEGDTCNKFLKPLASSLLGSIADNKKSMRDAVVSAMQMIVTLNKEGSLADTNLLSTLLTTSVESLINPVGREELLGFFMQHVESDIVLTADCSELAQSLVVSLQDKVAATRMLTEQLMTTMVTKGYLTRQAVEKSFRNLAPAVLRSLQAPKDRILSCGSKNCDDNSTTEAVVEPVKMAPKQLSRSMSKSAASSKAVAVTSATANSTTSEGDNRTASDNPFFPLKKTNKLKRLEDYYKTNWPQPPEEPTENERSVLRTLWEPLLERPLFDILFPAKVVGLENQDSVTGAVSELLSILNNEATGATSGCTIGPKCHEMVIQHTDLMLKWVALALCLRESSNGLLKLLLLVATIFNKIKNVPNLQLHEGEIICILPALIDKSGHKSERHKTGFKHAINACSPIISSNRLCQLLVHGLSCKNKKTRVVCIEEIDRIVEVSGPSSLGKAGIREISATLNSKDTDVGVRNAALDFCFTLYMMIGYDRKKLTKLLGDVSERAVPMIDHRIKEKMKTHEKTVTEKSDKEGTKSIPENRRKNSHAKDTTSVPSSNNVLKSGAVTENVSTPAAKSVTHDVGIYEDDDVAFRLEMTPPDVDEDDEVQISYSSSVKGQNLNLEIIDSLPPPPVSNAVAPSSMKESLAELDAVYIDIIAKVDAAISINDSTDELVVRDSLKNAKDYLKLLHSMVTAYQIPDPGNKAYEILQRHAPTLVDKIMQCIDFGFQFKLPGCEDTCNLNVMEVGLVSVSLACMFALLDCKDLLRDLNESAVTHMISTGIKWLVDTRFFPSEGSSIAPKVEKDLSKALNAFLIKIGSGGPFNNGLVICSIIEILSLCIEEKDIVNPMPTSCAKPLSRLLLKVLSNEVSRGPNEAFHLPHVDAMRLMSVLHSFFNSHPSTVPSTDVPYCCAKTVLAQLLEALGPNEVDRLAQRLKIPETSFVYRLSKRLTPQLPSAENNITAPHLIPSIVEKIDAISTSRDKIQAIKQLKAALVMESSVDISQYLHHTSSTFRNFVLDTLKKLDNNNTSVDSLGKVDDKQADGAEALRILEGLKSNSKRNMLASPLNENIDTTTVGSVSSRSLMQDKAQVSASSSQSSSDQNISTTIKSGVGADSDLAARLARLRRMESGSTK